MGRQEKYRQTLHQQAYNELKKQLSFGEEKNKELSDGKIYAEETYKTYKKHIGYFLRYVKETYPECSKLKDAKQYTKEWLEKRESEGKSAWTLHTEAKALGKLFQIKPEDDEYYQPPTRRKEDIKRSRNYGPEHQRLFSEKSSRNKPLIEFCKHTGLRRRGVKSITNNCLYTKNDIALKIKEYELKERTKDVTRELEALTDTQLFNEEWYIRVKEKGGRIRYAPILNNNQNVIDIIKNTPDGKKVWQYVSPNAPVHKYRSDYANSIYNKYSRDIDAIPKFFTDKKGDVHFGGYFLRGEQKGRKLDREALYITSKALGHNRVTVVADNYM